MSKTKIFVGALIIVLVLMFIPRLFKPKKEEVPIVGNVLFSENFEGSPTIQKMTHEEWMQMNEDTKARKYGRDDIYWLEMGWITDTGNYIFETRDSTATVTSEFAHDGKNSVFLSIPPNPEGYPLVGRWVVRYLRDLDKIVHGTYRTEAWFYIPSGETTIAHLHFEDHIDYKANHYFYLVLDPTQNCIGYFYEDWRFGKYEKLGDIDFKYDTWFKLWVVGETGQTQGWTAGYESIIENKTYTIDNVLTAPHPGYKGLTSFNIYAGGLQLDGNSGSIFIDDFKAVRLN